MVATQDRCQAVSGSYRRERRCSQQAIGAFERTRKAYKNEDAWPGEITEPVGKLCRRHARMFNAREVAR